MKITSVFNLFLVSSVYTLGVSFPGPDIIARTNQGLVRGTKVHKDVNAFLGIPYAQPPIGHLRFRPAEPLQPLHRDDNRTLNATTFGPVCYQFHYKTVLGDSLLPTTTEAEDCLTLNVFVSGHFHRKRCGLAVYVWSFGGAFGEGGGSVPLFNPARFVAENRDIIVVTWNYRLNLFGFPNSPALDAQNLGIQDQRLALEWLRDNISGFGGDPDHIVLGGQSSGADTASAMVYSQADDPIAIELALQSGTVQVIGAETEEVDAEFVRVAEVVGCANSLDRREELKCMQSIDADVLKHAISNETFNLFGSSAGGSPMVDNVTLFTLNEYAKRGKEGNFAKIPILVGNLNNEGDSVLNWSPQKGVNKTFSEIVTTTMFNCNVALEAMFRSMNNVPIWRYRYMGVFPEATPYPWLGSYHEADIPILLGTYDTIQTQDVVNSTTQVSIETKKASQFLQHIFASFIRNPAGGLYNDFGWPMFEPNKTTLLELFRNNSATTSRVDAGMYDDICSNPPPIPRDQLLPPTA